MSISSRRLHGLTALLALLAGCAPSPPEAPETPATRTAPSQQVDCAPARAAFAAQVDALVAAGKLDRASRLLDSHPDCADPGRNGEARKPIERELQRPVLQPGDADLTSSALAAAIASHAHGSCDGALAGLRAAKPETPLGRVLAMASAAAAECGDAAAAQRYADQARRVYEAKGGPPGELRLMNAASSDDVGGRTKLLDDDRVRADFVYLAPEEQRAIVLRPIDGSRDGWVFRGANDVSDLGAGRVAVFFLEGSTVSGAGPDASHVVVVRPETPAEQLRFPALRMPGLDENRALLVVVDADQVRLLDPKSLEVRARLPRIGASPWSESVTVWVRDARIVTYDARSGVAVWDRARLQAPTVQRPTWQVEKASAGAKVLGVRIEGAKGGVSFCAADADTLRQLGCFRETTGQETRGITVSPDGRYAGRTVTGPDARGSMRDHIEALDLGHGTTHVFPPLPFEGESPPEILGLAITEDHVVCIFEKWGGYMSASYADTPRAVFDLRTGAPSADALCIDGRTWPTVVAPGRQTLPSRYTVFSQTEISPMATRDEIVGSIDAKARAPGDEILHDIQLHVGKRGETSKQRSIAVGDLPREGLALEVSLAPDRSTLLFYAGGEASDVPGSSLFDAKTGARLAGPVPKRLVFSPGGRYAANRRGDPVMTSRGVPVEAPRLDFAVADDSGPDVVALDGAGVLTLSRDAAGLEPSLACIFGDVVAPARVCTERQLVVGVIAKPAPRSRTPSRPKAAAPATHP